MQFSIDFLLYFTLYFCYFFMCYLYCNGNVFVVVVQFGFIKKKKKSIVHLSKLSSYQKTVMVPVTRGRTPPAGYPV